MSPTHGTIGWIELLSADPQAACRYYSDLFGWSFHSTDLPAGPYHIATAHGRQVAGIMDRAHVAGLEGVPDHWMSYVTVEDAHALADAVAAAGGRVIRAPFDVGAFRLALVADGTGAVIGVMQVLAPRTAPAPEEGDDPEHDNMPV